MASPKKSNGSLIPTGTLTAPANASRRVTPTLPSFVSSRSQHAHTDQLASARGRLKSWEHLPTDKLIRKGAQASAKADASRGVRAFGNLMMVVMMGFALVMAAAALHQESALQQQEQHVLEVR